MEQEYFILSCADERDAKAEVGLEGKPTSRHSQQQGLLSDLTVSL